MILIVLLLAGLMSIIVVAFGSIIMIVYGLIFDSFIEAFAGSMLLLSLMIMMMEFYYTFSDITRKGDKSG